MMTSNEMAKLGIAIVEYMKAQGLDKHLEQAVYLMANPMVTIDVEKLDAVKLIAELDHTKHKPEPIKAHTVNADIDEAWLQLLPNPLCDLVFKAARCSETVGKPQNNSGCAENHGYAETVSGKPQNNSDDDFARWYAEMTGTDCQVPNYSAIRNNLMNAKRIEDKQATLLKYMNNATSGKPCIMYSLLPTAFKPTLDDMINGLLSMYNLKGCLDKTVVAVLVTQDGIFFGINGVEYLPNKCPREGKGINQGYAQCQHVCRQPHHAETMAIQQAKAMGVDLKLKSIIHVYGANGVCSNCLEVLRAEGITLGKTSNNLADFEADWSKDYAVRIDI